MLRNLWADENGFIISAELALVLTVGVLAMVVGLHQIAKELNNELLDIASAFGNLSQSYIYNGFAVVCPGVGVNAAVSGSGFVDTADTCDCAILVHVPPVPKVQNPVAGGGGNG